MRMRRHHQQQIDESALQADVMRFLAIVAFCLIAILAMVRNIEPSDAQQAATEHAPQPIPVASTTPRIETTQAVPELAPAQPVEIPEVQPLTTRQSNSRELAAYEPPQIPTKTLPELIQKPELIEKTELIQKSELFENPDLFIKLEPLVTPELPSKPAAVKEPEIAKQSEPTREPKVVEKPATLSRTKQTAEIASEPTSVIQQAKEAENTTEETPGLTLRFASQSDFLRLVARGRVSVHAYTPNKFLSMNSGYEFAEATPPGQVYEMRSDTIPRPVQTALARAHQLSEPTWAVALPSNIEAQLQKHVDQAKSGSLFINRYEEVRYEAIP